MAKIAPPSQDHTGLWWDDIIPDGAVRKFSQTSEMQEGAPGPW